MTWGVATALLEQRGDEGLFEVDEAWLPRVAAELDPRLIVLGNLFRDQLDRYGELEHLADEWAEVVAARAGATGFALNADDPLIADLGRDRELAPPPGRHLLRDRRPEPGAAGAPARVRRQALPALRRALRLRAGLRRPPGPLLVPELRRRPARRPTSPRPGSSSRECAARASPCARPSGEVELRLPLPGLYNVYNALAALTAALRLGIPLEPAAGALETMEAVFGRVETIEVGGKPRLDPPDQEPGRRERGAPHPAAGGGRRGDGRRPRSVDRAQRPDRRRAGRLLGLGCGLRAARRPRPPRGLRRHAGRRDGGAPEVRRHAAGGDRGRGVDRPLARPGGRRGRRPAVRPAHLHGAARASHPALAARPGADATGRELRRPSGTRSSAVATRRTSPSGRSWRTGADGPVLELGCGTGRVALHLARRGREVWAVDADPSLLEALEDTRGRASGWRSRAECADVRALALDRRFRADHRPHAAHADARRTATSVARSLQRAAAHLAPRRASRGGDRRAPRPPRSGRPGAGLPDVRERDGWVYSSLPVVRVGTDGRRHGDPPAAAVGLPRRLAERGGAHRPARCSGRRHTRGRGGQRGPRRRRAGSRSGPATTTSGRPSSSSGGHDGAPAARALPRADEHLRRPGQHPVPASDAASGAGSASRTPPRGPANRSIRALTT